MTTTNKPIPVWRDGKWMDETHLMATGNAPDAATTALTDEWRPMAIPVHFSAVVTPGDILERLHEGRHEAMVSVALYNGKRLESPIYGLVPEADQRSGPDIYDSTQHLPIRHLTKEWATEQAALATAARIRMKEDERSPLDMIAEAREKAADARRLEAEWQREQAKQAEQARIDAEDIALFQRVERGRKLAEKGKK